MSDRHELLRQLQELALSYGRKHRSSQTGYVHYCYNVNDQEPHLTIPTVENFLYALALLKSRTIDNINEAKTVIEGLLPFQNTSKGTMGSGNFPIYLHEFPICKDRFTGVRVGAPIYWILKQFHHVIGVDLAKRLEKTLLTVIQHSLATQTEKSAPYSLAVEIASLAVAGGHLLGQAAIEEQGNAMLKELCDDPDRSAWFCPSSMGRILAALSMVYVGNIGKSSWKDFWEHLQVTWHSTTSTYAGPGYRDWEWGSEPQVTVYDLFMGYLSGGFSSRCLKESPSHLEAVLIPSFDEHFSEGHFPIKASGTLDNAKWEIYQEESFAYALIEQGKTPLNPIYEKGFHPFRLLWGDNQRVHSLVNQSGNNKETTFQISEDSISMFFNFEGEAEVEDREKTRDVCFYIDSHAGLESWVGNSKSSTFQLDEPLIFLSDRMKIILTFQRESGEGRYIGHRMLGNRSSQLNIKGSRRYDAYDWVLFLRTLGRQQQTTIKATLKICYDS